jgi:hypothetical protein
LPNRIAELNCQIVKLNSFCQTELPNQIAKPNYQTELLNQIVKLNCLLELQNKLPNRIAKLKCQTEMPNGIAKPNYQTE